MMVSGCGPAYLPVPDARIIARQDFTVDPKEHGIAGLGPLPLPSYLVGNLGRGRAVVVHAFPHETLAARLSVSPAEYFASLCQWLAEPRREVA